MTRHCIPIPFPSFEESVACYSAPTLQYVLHVLSKTAPLIRQNDVPGWLLGEVFCQWNLWRPAFYQFARLCTDAASKANVPIPDPLPGEITRGVRQNPLGSYRHPAWMGWSRLHQVHKQRLLFFGLVEQVLQRLDNTLPDSDLALGFLEDFGFRQKSDVYTASATALGNFNSCLNLIGAAPPGDNNYARFNWSLLPDNDSDIRYLSSEEQYFATRPN